MDTLTVVIAAISTAIGVIVTKVIELWSKKSEINQADRKAELEIEIRKKEESHKAYDYLFKQYKEITKNLEENTEQLQAQINFLRDEHTKCREEYAAVKAELILLQKQFEKLKN